MATPRKKNPIVKNVKRQLRCVFTNSELLVIGKSLAELRQQREALENDKKRVVSDFSAKLAAVDAEESIAANKIASGYEIRAVECRVLLDAPEPGQKTLVRLDTDEVAGIEEMTDADRQLNLIEPEEAKS